MFEVIISKSLQTSETFNQTWRKYTLVNGLSGIILIGRYGTLFILTSLILKASRYLGAKYLKLIITDIPNLRTFDQNGSFTPLSTLQQTDKNR